MTIFEYVNFSFSYRKGEVLHNELSALPEEIVSLFRGRELLNAVVINYGYDATEILTSMMPSKQIKIMPSTRLSTKKRELTTIADFSNDFFQPGSPIFGKVAPRSFQ